MDIEKMIEEIIKGIDPSWNKLTVIRYVYIEVGKRVSRDTDFFFSVDDKLGDLNLTEDEIAQIYDCEYGRGNKVICKSASNILKKVYDRLGIECKLVRYNNSIHWEKGKDKLTIYHWFLAVKDDIHTYFLTLNSDLPNIQMGLKTEHFANLIRHTKVINGKKIQIYEGEPIRETALGDELLASIDERIGYVKNYYKIDSKGNKSKDYKLEYEDAALAMLKEEMKGNKLYYDLLICDSDFFSYFLKVRDKYGKKYNLIDNKFDELPDDMWLRWKRKICKVVVQKIEKMLGVDLNMQSFLSIKNWNYEVFLMRLCVLCEDRILRYYNKNQGVDIKDLRVDVENFQYNKWSNKIKSTFNVKSNYDYNSVLLLIDKMNAIMRAIDRKDSKTFNNLYRLLAFHFIPSIAIYENNIDREGYLSNAYIANKFQELFINTFSCNEILTPFNKMSYSEQVVIIKRVLEILFPEINYENSSGLKGYNNNYNAVMNRIHIYPVKSLRSGNYSIVFNIIGNQYEDDYYFFYNPRENTFKVADALEVYSDYVVISERMKDRFNIENIEKLGMVK